LPHAHWQLPKDWKEIAAGDMRVAAFQVTGNDGQSAEVTIIPLPGAANRELESVNIWRREQLQLTPWTADEMAKAGEPVEIGDGKGQLFDMASGAPKEGAKFKTRLLGAIASRENVLWFIKMVGDDALVAAQKPAFIGFLKSLTFETDHQMAAANDRPVSTNTKKLPPEAGSPKWKVPPTWEERAPGPMISSAYSIKGDEGNADVTVSKFPGEVGGMAANVNRWRRQLGLSPQSEAEMQGSVQLLEIDGHKNAYRVDLKGTNARSGKEARMIAVAVPRGGETWFYKLLGDAAAVEKEKDAFQEFVTSAY
jgi:hypothetical protein